MFQILIWKKEKSFFIITDNKSYGNYDFSSVFYSELYSINAVYK